MTSLLWHRCLEAPDFPGLGYCHTRHLRLIVETFQACSRALTSEVHGGERSNPFVTGRFDIFRCRRKGLGKRPDETGRQLPYTGGPRGHRSDRRLSRLILFSMQLPPSGVEGCPHWRYGCYLRSNVHFDRHGLCAVDSLRRHAQRVADNPDQQPLFRILRIYPISEGPRTATTTQRD